MTHTNTGPKVKFDVPLLGDYNTRSAIDNLVKAYVDTVAKYVEVLSAIEVTVNHIGEDDYYHGDDEIRERLDKILKKHMK